jgi:hypothetical protein
MFLRTLFIIQLSISNFIFILITPTSDERNRPSIFRTQISSPCIELPPPNHNSLISGPAEKRARYAKAFSPGVRGIQNVEGDKGESFSLSFERKDNMVSRVRLF